MRKPRWAEAHPTASVPAASIHEMSYGPQVSRKARLWVRLTNVGWALAHRIEVMRKPRWAEAHPTASVPAASIHEMSHRSQVSRKARLWVRLTNVGWALAHRIEVMRKPRWAEAHPTASVPAASIHEMSYGPQVSRKARLWVRLTNVGWALAHRIEMMRKPRWAEAHPTNARPSRLRWLNFVPTPASAKIVARVRRAGRRRCRGKRHVPAYADAVRLPPV